MTIKVASGFDNWASLTDLVTEVNVLYTPRAPGPTPATERRLLDGHRQIAGPLTATLEYNDYLSAAALLSVLQQLDIDEAESAELTMQVPGRLRDDEVWNVIAHRPAPVWKHGRYEPVTIPLYLIAYLPSAFTTAFSGEFA